MGTLAPTIKRLLYSLIISISRIITFFSHSHSGQLHTARFAPIHEMTPLLGSTLADMETSLLLGRNRFNRFACVRPTKTRRELGKLLVCAPTRSSTTMLQQMFLAARREGIAPFPYIRFLIQLGLSDTASRLHAIDPKLATRFLDTKFLNADLTDKFLLSS